MIHIATAYEIKTLHWDRHVNVKMFTVKQLMMVT